MSRCDGCGGEDCVCCEVWQEQQADEKYERMYEEDQAPLDYGYYEPDGEDY